MQRGIILNHLHSLVSWWSGLAVKINFLRYLEAEILTKTFLRQPFCKIQDDSHIGLGANGNIGCLIAYTIMYLKMYIFDTIHKNPAKLHSEPD